jgi:hypothetical protein
LHVSVSGTHSGGVVTGGGDTVPVGIAVGGGEASTGVDASGGGAVVTGGLPSVTGSDVGREPPAPSTIWASSQGRPLRLQATTLPVPHTQTMIAVRVRAADGRLVPAVSLGVLGIAFATMAV